jgi:hypothetical protein
MPFSVIWVSNQEAMGRSRFKVLASNRFPEQESRPDESVHELRAAKSIQGLPPGNY